MKPRILHFAYKAQIWTKDASFAILCKSKEVKRVNISSLFGIKKNLGTFKRNHSDLIPDIKEVFKKGFCEGQEISVTVTYPDGTKIDTDVMLQESDVPFFNAIKELIMN